MMTSTWVHSTPKEPLPALAVVGGYDCGGGPIYVGRATYKGDSIPAKVIPSRGCAYVSWRGGEHKKMNYEILVGEVYSWQGSYGNAIPPNAVKGGYTSYGETLYVGRCNYGGSLCVGKVHPSHGCLYIPYGGREVRLGTYEILVYQLPHNWVPATPEYTPPEAVVAGHDTDRATIYVGRALYEGEMLPAKIIPSKGCAYVCNGGYEIATRGHEVLCGVGYAWMKPHQHVIPQNAVSTGRNRNGEPLFVGRCHYSGSITPGVISVSQRCLFVPYGGREVRFSDYEVLVKE